MFRILKRDRVRPERVVSARTELAETPDELCRAVDDATVVGIGQNPNEAVLRDRTRRPAASAVVGEPIVCELVMDVVGIEQCDEQVDVEQGSTHASSRRSLTSCIVGRRPAPGRRGSRGTPFLTRDVRAGVSARRARSESAFPAVIPRAAAISLAAWRTSSSRSSVVRTGVIIRHHASDVNAHHLRHFSR